MLNQIYDFQSRTRSEFIGTFIFIFCSVGTAAMTNLSHTPTALAFGLSIFSMAYSTGRISGCHLNPSVSFSYLLLGQLKIKEFFFLIIVQIVVALLGAVAVIGFLYWPLEPRLDQTNSWNISDATNTMLMYDDLGYSTKCVFSALLTEIVITMIYIYVYLNATEPGTSYRRYAGIIIGSTYCLLTLTGLTLTRASINPARSFATAITQIGYFDSTDSIQQIWIFIVGPFIGSFFGTYLYKFLHTVPIEYSRLNTVEKTNITSTENNDNNSNYIIYKNTQNMMTETTQNVQAHQNQNIYQYENKNYNHYQCQNINQQANTNYIQYPNMYINQYPYQYQNTQNYYH